MKHTTHLGIRYVWIKDITPLTYVVATNTLSWEAMGIFMFVTWNVTYGCVSNISFRTAPNVRQWISEPIMPEFSVVYILWYKSLSTTASRHESYSLYAERYFAHIQERSRLITYTNVRLFLLTELHIPILCIFIYIDDMDTIYVWVVYEVKGILKRINAWRQSSLISPFGVHCILNNVQYSWDCCLHGNNWLPSDWIRRWP